MHSHALRIRTMVDEILFVEVESLNTFDSEEITGLFIKSSRH